MEDPELFARRAVATGWLFVFAVWFMALVVTLGVIGVGVAQRWDEPAIAVAGVLLGSLGALLAGFATSASLASFRFRAARTLSSEGHAEQAVRLLKPLSRHYPLNVAPHSRGDHATYEIARIYEECSEERLAVEAYKNYLARYPNGAWAMEARVRLEELDPTALQVQVEESPKADLRCPYCKDTLTETPWECEECHTPHHESCYAESGGCATYGCGKAAAERKVAQ